MLPEEVEKVTRSTTAAPMKPLPKSKSKPKVVESSDEDEQPEPANAGDLMYVDDEPAEVKKRKPRKKVEKKVVPVGRNGLKKKRIMKSRMSIDAKGYMGRGFLIVDLRQRTEGSTPVTEDYSSYESVDEEEESEEPEKPKKKLTSKPSEPKLKRNASSKDTKAPSKEIKKRASMGGASSSKSVAGKGNLMSYFGKKP